MELLPAVIGATPLHLRGTLRTLDEEQVTSLVAAVGMAGQAVAYPAPPRALLFHLSFIDSIVATSFIFQHGVGPAYTRPFH